MNIFYIDQDPKAAAQFLADQHLIKMQLESCQLLSTFCQYRGIHVEGMYKPCYLKHPSNLWLLDDNNNVAWLLVHLDEMYEEYYRRYGEYKIPKTYGVYTLLSSVILRHIEIEKNELYSAAMKLTHVRLAMYPWLKEKYGDIASAENAVLAYREYYNLKEIQVKEEYKLLVKKGLKQPKLFTWTYPGVKPDWYTGTGINIEENKKKLFENSKKLEVVTICT